MEANQKRNEPYEDDEEFIFLDLEGVSTLVDIPFGAPYTLSGLDTLNPILVIGDSLKLIGEYQETLGTCLIFSESDSEPITHPETGPSDRNLFKDTCIIADKAKIPSKDVLPLASLQKILRFRLLKDDEAQKELNGVSHAKL